MIPSTEEQMVSKTGLKLINSTRRCRWKTVVNKVIDKINDNHCYDNVANQANNTKNMRTVEKKCLSTNDNVCNATMPINDLKFQNQKSNRNIKSVDAKLKSMWSSGVPLSFFPDTKEDSGTSLVLPDVGIQGKSSAAKKYAVEAMRNHVACSIASSSLLHDIQEVLNGGSIYLPSFFCDSTDFSLYYQLLLDICNHYTSSKNSISSELNISASFNPNYDSTSQSYSSLKLLEDSAAIIWSRHMIIENPEFSNAFNNILQKLRNYFDVSIYASRLNFYRNGSDWKPFHHDSHAYVNIENNSTSLMSEDFTMGASFGAPRKLVFLHEKSGETFSFPQKNGDVFAFNGIVNKAFKHGVPKEFSTNNLPTSSGGVICARFSVIAWGRRNSLNTRNAADSEITIL